MLDKLEQTLSKLNISKQDAPCLLGVSGGADSIALAYAMHQLGFQFIIAHFNHLYRDEALSDAKHVERFANSISMPIVYGEGSIEDHAKLNSLSIEEAARDLRYKFLFATASDEKALAVIVAHTASDQAETVLLHLLRGAGLAGLTGMDDSTVLLKYHVSIPLLRPLLGIWRKEIVDYCQKNQLNPVEDATNLDRKFLRNRIRHELIPTLEEYNPNIKQAIWRMADVLRADNELLNQIVKSQLEEIQGFEAEGYCSLALDKFHEQSIGIQRRILRRSIAKLRPELRDISFDAIDRAIMNIDSPPKSNSFELMDGLEILLEDKTIWILEQGTQLPFTMWPQLRDFETKLIIPANINLNHGWQLDIKYTEQGVNVSAIKKNHDSFSVWMDFERLGPEVVLRRRQPGDCFQPLGIKNGSQKLKDSFINAKIPRRAREQWPLIASGQTIHWIPGYRQSQLSRVTKDTKRIVHLSISSPSQANK